MKMHLTLPTVVAIAVFLAWLGTVPGLSGATSLRGDGASPGKGSGPSPKGEVMTKDEILMRYMDGCRVKSDKEGNCDKLRKDGVEILKEDLSTLGSSTNRTYMPVILKMFKSDEAELRIAAADAIGMIGPQDGDIDLLAPLTNDPVPDVRRAVAQMISHGKGSAISLLGQRITSMRSGLTPETPVDPGKYSMPVAPESIYLYYASDATRGRLSYVARKGLDPTIAFFKSKAKRGPLKLDDFNTLYRYQLSDEQEARERILKEAGEAKSKQAEAMMKDPSNQQAALEKVMQIQGDMASQIMIAGADRYQSDIFESPTVFVLEERQIGQRNYPTRYVVLYHDKALRMPGYRLSWMMVPDDAIKTAQAVSLVSEKEEAARTKENEVLKKRAEALQNLEKKKDEQEKKNFKKGQADLEKELGF
jgi:hypothetical protein